MLEYNTQQIGVEKDNVQQDMNVSLYEIAKLSPNYNLAIDTPY